MIRAGVTRLAEVKQSEVLLGVTYSHQEDLVKSLKGLGCIVGTPSPLFSGSGEATTLSPEQK